MCNPVSGSQLPSTPADVRNIDQLRTFIHVLLCRKENLLEHHFPMTELELKQRNRSCGFQFVLHGPRSVRLAAVWAQETNVILCYDATGKRFARIQLPNPVDAA